MSVRYCRPLIYLTVLVCLSALSGPAHAEIEAPPEPEPSIPPQMQLDESLQDYGEKGPNPLPFFAGTPLLAPPVEGFNFNDNGFFTPFLFIPPDPHIAVGPAHAVNIGNVLIEWRSKDAPDPEQFRLDLRTFFSGLPSWPGPGTTLSTFTFDPKVVYDQYADRFVVVTLERWFQLIGNPANESRILIAVSQTSDPNAGWWFHAIDAKVVATNNIPHWVDYPGIAIDNKAIYVTANMFSFPGFPGSFEHRLWIIDKGPTYAGPNNSIAYTVHDAYGAVGRRNFRTTTQPAHTYGALPLGSTGLPLGTFLVSYSGLTFGGPGAIEALNVIEVTDPLGTPQFTQQFVPCGDIEDVGGVFGFPRLPDAPQLGGPALIEVNDRRALNAVWRNGYLYASATIIANSGVDAGQTTAHWWKVDTSNPMPGLVCADEGDVGADADLGPGTFTFFPSVMVDDMDNMAIGFSASNEQIYCGAYYATRFADDPPGFIGPTCALAPGTDYYLRTFGGSRNRWGDYSGLALCPADEATFWVYNEYACDRGVPTGGQDGRWCTKVGYFQKRPVVLDIKPGSCPNPFNVRFFDFVGGGFQNKTGVLPVAIFGGSDYDAQDIDVSTILLEGVPPDTRGNLPTITDLGAPYGEGCACTTEPPGADPYLDLTVKFSKQAIAAAIVPGARGEERTLTLTGQYLDGTPFALEDCIVFVGEPERTPRTTSLGPAYPNPFNPVVRIRYYVPTDAWVELTVYDVKGEPVETLVDRLVTGGEHTVTWDAKAASSGVYFYRLKSDEFSETRKMILLK